MKKWICISLLLIAGFLFNGFCAETIEIEITEVPYVQPYAFLGITFETGGQRSVGLTADADSQIDPKEMNFSIWMMSARHNQDFQFQTHLGYRGIDIAELQVENLASISGFEIFLGGRFFPRYPTFSLSRLPVRLTLSVIGGLSMLGNNFNFGMIISAGLIITSGDSPTGITMEIGYRPGNTYIHEPDYSSSNQISLTIEASWIFRIGFLFAP